MPGLHPMSQVVLTMKRQGLKLVPYGDVAAEILSEVTVQRPVIVTVHQARNPKHHARLWALAARVANFGPHFKDAEHAIRWVKRQIPGMHRRYKERDGTLVIELESISFASMDQVRFNAFYDEAVRQWAQMLGCDPELLGTED
jgi:hypothetical protein